MPGQKTWCMVEDVVLAPWDNNTFRVLHDSRALGCQKHSVFNGLLSMACQTHCVLSWIIIVLGWMCLGDYLDLGTFLGKERSREVGELL